MITEDDAINLICIARGDDSANTKRGAKTALDMGRAFVIAEGGGGWDWSKEDLTFSTVANQQDYYVNKKPSMTPGTAVIDKAGTIISIDEIWYADSTGSRTHLVKMPEDEWKANYQGLTTTGTPKAWTAYGNILRIAYIPDGAYSLSATVYKAPAGFEDVPPNQQFAVLAAALAVIFPPSKEFGPQAQERLQMAFDALGRQDGLMDFASDVSGSF